MAQPTLSSVHVNRPLTAFSLMFAQSMAGAEFVAERAFPALPVDKQSDVYFEYTRGDFNRDTMKLRGLSSESAGDGYKVDANPTYTCQQWSLHKDIDDRIRANRDTPLSPDRDATIFLTQKALTRKEVFWTSQYFKTGVWTANCTGNSSASSIGNSGTFGYWDLATSTPVEDIRAAKTQMRLNSGGYTANKIIFDEPTWNALIDHPSLVDRVKYGQTGPRPAMVSRQILAEILELDEVLVSNAIQNTAMEGATE